VQRAAWFYKLNRYSYASGLTSYGSQPLHAGPIFLSLSRPTGLLAKVVFENKDFEKMIMQYDRRSAFF
jgi:DNA adenine methylase